MLKSRATFGVDGPEISERVRRILAACGLSARRLEEISRKLYGTASPFYIPPNFLTSLKHGVSPPVTQVLTLSQATDYRLSEWLRVLGFEVANITHLQLQLHDQRSVIVSPSEIIDSQLLRTDTSGHSDAMCAGESMCLKLGKSDGMAFPEFLPGSIVAVDTTDKELPRIGSGTRVMVVEHLFGITCCHVARLSREDILLVPNYLAYPCFRLHLGDQAMIRGVPIAEVRAMSRIDAPVPGRSPRRERPTRPVDPGESMSAAQTLRAGRERLGMRFREAHALTRRIAATLGDPEYAISLGSLSDYEASDSIPRHIAKIFSLCITYALDLTAYLRAANIDLRRQGSRVMRQQERGSEPESATPCILPPPYSSLFPCSVIEGFIKAAHCENPLSRLELTSVAEDTGVSAAALLIDRNSRAIEAAKWESPWERPQYLVRHRSGRLLLGFCTSNDGYLTIHKARPELSVHSYPIGDVEVIGRVNAIVRSLPDPAASRP